MDKIIKETKIKGDLIVDGKLIFEAGLGRVEIGGKIEATIGIEVGEGTDISSGGYISSGGDISFSYHIAFKTKISCKSLRISPDNNFERKFWIEKFNLFGFKEVAKIIEKDCATTIRQELLEIKNLKAKLLKCKYWTKIEKMVIVSWLDGELKDYKISE